MGLLCHLFVRLKELKFICYIYNEHTPPHIHAFYQGNDMIVEIASAKNLNKTKIPAKIQNKIISWVKAHQNELMDIWTSQVFKKLGGNY